MERITVIESVVGKFGPQLKDVHGYLSFGKFYKGQTAFPAGTRLEVDLFITAKGNRYINFLKMPEGVQASIPSIAPSNTSSAVEAGVIRRGRKPKSTGTAEEVVNKLPMKKEVDWDELGRGKTASLFVAALLQNPNVVQSLDVDVNGMESLVWDLVDLVFKTRKTTV